MSREEESPAGFNEIGDVPQGATLYRFYLSMIKINEFDVNLIFPYVKITVIY